MPLPVFHGVFAPPPPGTGPLAYFRRGIAEDLRAEENMGAHENSIPMITKLNYVITRRIGRGNSGIGIIENFPHQPF